MERCRPEGHGGGGGVVTTTPLMVAVVVLVEVDMVMYKSDPGIDGTGLTLVLHLFCGGDGIIVHIQYKALYKLSRLSETSGS